MSTPQALLELKDLRIAFGGQAVVHGVNLSIQAGERVALVGESGSGKSVCSQAIMGLLPRTATIASGSILFQDPRVNQGVVDIARIDSLHSAKTKKAALEELKYATSKLRRYQDLRSKSQHCQMDAVSSLFRV